MKVEIEVHPTEMLGLLNAIFAKRKAAPHPVQTDIPDLVRACFLAGLDRWES